MKHTPVPPSFVYPEIKPTDYRFGTTNAGPILRENGDWRDFLPPEEAQNKNGVESSACYIEAPQHTIATILEAEHNLPDQNFSSRFNFILSDGTEYGGDPLKGAYSIHKDGLVMESMMPFDSAIDTWTKFASWFGVNENACRAAGRLFVKRWILNYFIVFERDEPVKVKYEKLREALKRSPVPMSVYGWYENNGVYIKRRGYRDQHMVECVYLDEQNRPHWRDTYPPYYKIGEPFYNSDFAMRWSVKKVIKETVAFWEALKNFFKYVTTIKLD